MVHGSAMLLLTAIGGYWVLERAEGHKGSLKRIGKILGGSIILLSLLGIACQTWGSGGAACPFGKGDHRPFAERSFPPPPRSR